MARARNNNSNSKSKSAPKGRNPPPKPPIPVTAVPESPSKPKSLSTDKTPPTAKVNTVPQPNLNHPTEVHIDTRRSASASNNSSPPSFPDRQLGTPTNTTLTDTNPPANKIVPPASTSKRPSLPTPTPIDIQCSLPPTPTCITNLPGPNASLCIRDHVDACIKRSAKTIYDNLIQHYSDFVEPYITAFISPQLNETASTLKDTQHILEDLN